METVAHLAEDSDEDFSGLPTLEDKGHEKKVSKSEEEVGEKAPEEDTNKSENDSAVLDDDGWEDVLGSGRLKKRIMKEGEEGRKPGKGTRVRVKVEERVAGEVVMQETSIEFNVGESEVLQCLDLVLPLMCKGEEAEVTSEHSFAYGVKGDCDWDSQLRPLTSNFGFMGFFKKVMEIGLLPALTSNFSSPWKNCKNWLHRLIFPLRFSL